MSSAGRAPGTTKGKPKSPSKSVRGARPSAFGPNLLYWAIVGIVFASAILPSRTSSALIQEAFGSPGTALFLTAHPDDEVMFFAPSILGLRKAGWEVQGLCLSTGNADGLGSTRRHELTASYEMLGVKQENVMVIDHPLLQDDIKTRWSGNIVGAVVDSYLSQHNIDMIITFDRQGISNHPNHASLSLYRSNSTSIYHLVSPSLATKYTGSLLRYVPSSVLSRLDTWQANPKETVTLEADVLGWKTAIQAMIRHHTQMVWFRWFYIATSRLMWINQLERVS